MNPIEIVPTPPRLTHLRNLVDTYHRSHNGDYDDTYEEFAATYLPECAPAPEFDVGQEPIPKYASCAEDETYGMIHLFDNLTEALQDQAGIPDNGETLNVPAGIYDLDTGKQIDTVTVTMTKSAFETLCLHMADEDDDNWSIFSENWGELQELFPITYFTDGVPAMTEETTTPPPLPYVVYGD